MLSSFDVYDTVLTRNVGSPEALFLLLGRLLSKEGLIDMSPEMFARIRIESERCAYRNHGSLTTLHHIYNEILEALNLNETKCAIIMAAEVNFEEMLICMVPGISKILDEVRRNGRNVIFISDMYMSSSFIQKQLARFYLWKPGDVCYVSCEHGMTKAEGLYKKILKD